MSKTKPNYQGKGELFQNKLLNKKNSQKATEA